MDDKLLRVGLEAVSSAEAEIKKHFKPNIQYDLKADLSPVTIADKNAENIIKHTILKHFPEHTFFGEEGKKIKLDGHKGYTWIIDPIDGTKSYMRQNPLFATQLALLHNGKLIIGISSAPLLNETVYAQKGKGCYVNDKPIKVSGVSNIVESYMSFGSLKYFSQTNTIDQLLVLANEVRWARGIGDFWSYHLIAQGKLEIMIEPYTKLWDIAALSVIINEAGGSMTQLDGKPIDVTSTSALATNGILHDQIVKRFTK